MNERIQDCEIIISILEQYYPLPLPTTTTYIVHSTYQPENKWQKCEGLDFNVSH